MSTYSGLKMEKNEKNINKQRLIYVCVCVFGIVCSSTCYILRTKVRILLAGEDIFEK